MKSNLVPALILIILGVLLLANNLIPEFRIWSTLIKWWPLALVAIGASMLVKKS
jgi:lia operon protein LiaF